MTKSMQGLLRLEDLGAFLLSIFLFNQLDFAWWVYPSLLLLPDLSMLGYLYNAKVGAYVYNFFHHQLLGMLCWMLGMWLEAPELALAGLILFGHAAMDRLFGYGLKYNDSFHNTHLGWIGKKAADR
ncbi:MAG: DUF4260 domain-containing protein [Sphingobacteriaceae bacterium]|nr:DUF4260 domain-containing protein [Sphingobacteriaceae bacterium]